MIQFFSRRGKFSRADVAGMVKRLTRRIVAPLRVGSNPTTRPIFIFQTLIESQNAR